MKDILAKLKDCGVLVWFVLSALVTITAISIYDYGKKKRFHSVMEHGDAARGSIQVA